MQMLAQFLEYVSQNNLWQKNNPLLLACSGGLDSMVLLDLLRISNQRFSVAHCNFKLRGKHADEDEAFLRTYTAQHKIDFYSTSFETASLAKEKGKSIQMMARLLRYEWLEKLRKEIGAHFILTAHHLDDQAETMMANIIKGTGIRGLRGILPKSGKIVRPLLAISKNELKIYATEKQIPFREDASNLEDKYQRNYIRHHIMPLMENVNSQYLNSFSNLSKRIRDYEKLAELSIDKIIRKQLIKSNLYEYISINYIRKQETRSTLIYELFAPYGFTNELCREIDQHLESPQSGKQFLSPSHRIIVDRKRLIIAPLAIESLPIQFYDHVPNQILFGGFKIQVKLVPIDKLVVKKSKQYAYLDFEKLSFPLSIRQWQNGDYFYPYGLTKTQSNKVGKKKIAKYLKDEKFNAIEKEYMSMIFSGEKCVWLVGERIDDRFKVTQQTKQVLKLKVVKSAFTNTKMS